MHSGMRLGELASLTWADVDLHQSIIFLRETKSGVPRSEPLSKEAKVIIEEIAPSNERTGIVFKERRLGGKASICNPFIDILSLLL